LVKVKIKFGKNINFSTAVFFTVENIHARKQRTLGNFEKKLHTSVYFIHRAPSGTMSCLGVCLNNGLYNSFLGGIFSPSSGRMCFCWFWRWKETTFPLVFVNCHSHSSGLGSVWPVPPAAENDERKTVDRKRTG